MRKNIAILTGAHALFFMCNTILISTSPLIGLALAPQPNLATLPLGIQFVGGMGMTLPASHLMGRWGRRNGLVVGNVFGILSGLTGFLAILWGSFSLFLLSSFLYGNFSGFCSYYRFAAADDADQSAGNDLALAKKGRARAMGFVLAGGVIAAVIGPTIAQTTKSLVLSAEFAGSYLAVAFLCSASFVILTGLSINKTKAGTQGSEPLRPLLEIFRQPDAMLALLSGISGYVTMNFLMTATPLAMHAAGHHFHHSAFVIQWHVLGMFVPSFFTGHLIARFGEHKIILMGSLVMLASFAVNFNGVGLFHFVTGLLLLGIGWNFLFIGGTSLLTHCYTQAEKARAQGAHDFMLFSCVAISATSAGIAHEFMGWFVMNLLMAPLMLLTLVCCFKRLSSLIRTAPNL